MYLAILVKTDGLLSGFKPSDKTKDLDIHVYSHEVSTNLITGYFYSKNKIPDEHIERMNSNVENDEHVIEVEIMKYIEECE